MDEYQASIASVDSALSRLNQTLASYKLFAASTSPTPSSSGNKHAATTQTPPTVPTLQPVQAQVLPSTQYLDAAPQNEPSQPRHSDLYTAMLRMRSSQSYLEKDVGQQQRLDMLEDAFLHVADNPYSVPSYILLAIQYLGLGYPDLAAGSAYKALLLSDALDNDAEDYHEEVSDSLKSAIQDQPLEERIQIIRDAMEAGNQNTATATELDPALDIEITLWLKIHYRPIMYRILTRSLLLCGCFRSAYSYILQGLSLYQNDGDLLEIRECIYDSVRTATKSTNEDILSSPNDWPDSGLVRREIYPWNGLEPDRVAELDHINHRMRDVSEKLVVRAVQLPSLTGGPNAPMVTQLGVFAKEDINPAEVILDETSLLTANNKLQGALCDACSGDLPEVGSQDWENAVVCADCDVVFCSDWCFENARAAYHPALCGKDVEAIAKDGPPEQAADSLYSLLLLRALAMAETQEWHPLDVLDVRYIWGDFTPSPDLGHPMYSDLKSPDSCLVPRTLPFSFENNIRLPFHMLEKMEIDIFANSQYDVWVFNTLYAKFRGTASARLSGLGKKPRGPEVSAVHPMWCLANHSCDPNVSWRWGGAMKFWVKEERVAWRGAGGSKKVVAEAGIKKNEEILNHYCDVNLPVKERRDWARGALGGDCLCPRCVYEAEHSDA